MTAAPRENDHDPCPDCGLLGAPGYAPDERCHRRVHNEAVNAHRAKVNDGFPAFTHESFISLQRPRSWMPRPAASRQAPTSIPFYWSHQLNPPRPHFQDLDGNIPPLKASAVWPDFRRCIADASSLRIRMKYILVCEITMMFKCLLKPFIKSSLSRNNATNSGDICSALTGA